MARDQSLAPICGSAARRAFCAGGALCVGLLASQTFTAAAAGGKEASYGGSLKPRGKLSFSGPVRHHKVVSIAPFEWALVPMTCNNGQPPTVSNAGIDHVKVTGRSISGTQTTGSGKYQQVSTLSGKFSRDFKKATGTLAVHGNYQLDYAPYSEACTTGLVHWKAHLSRKSSSG